MNDDSIHVRPHAFCQVKTFLSSIPESIVMKMTPIKLHSFPSSIDIGVSMMLQCGKILVNIACHFQVIDLFFYTRPGVIQGLLYYSTKHNFSCFI